MMLRSQVFASSFVCVALALAPVSAGASTRGPGLMFAPADVDTQAAREAYAEGEKPNRLRKIGEAADAIERA
jgi:hypothetical protein